MTRTLFCLAAALMVGCAPRWTHPTKSERDFHRDRANCLAKAGQAAGNDDPYGGLKVSVYQSCMYGEGWTRE